MRINKEKNFLKDEIERIGSYVDLKKLRRKRILITGATGFLGQYLVATLRYADHLHALGISLTLVSRTGRHHDFLGSVPIKNETHLSLDLAKPFSIRGRFDYVFHAAGYGQPAKFTADPIRTFGVNVFATKALLEITRRSRGTFVFFSSAEIYGDIPARLLPVPETFYGNVGLEGRRAVYSESKRLGEVLCDVYRREFHVNAKVVRISHVYGPGAGEKDARVMSEFIRSALIKKHILLQDQGHAMKTYGYIGDVIAMIMFVAMHGIQTVYNVGGEDSMRIAQLAKRIASLCGAQVTFPRVERAAMRIGKDPQRVKLDLSRIKKEMKHFSFVPFRDGIQRTIAWHRR